MAGKTSNYLSPFKILVAEPNHLMCRVTRQLLSMLGARRIFTVSDSETAESHLKQGEIDFILSEWCLYTSDGIDLVRWLRAQAGDIRFTPFIMVTSQTRLQNVIMARNLGITEFVAKPFSANSPVTRIREVIERPRPFVSAGRYFGPDRWRRANPTDEGGDRRKSEALLIDGRSPNQDQIDRLVAGDVIR